MTCDEFWKTILLGCCLLFLLALPAQADFSAKVEALTVGSYKAKIAAVDELAGSGDERCIPILEAYLDGRLLQRKSDDKLLIGEKQGQVYVLQDPLTLAEVDQLAMSELDKVRVNNRLRGAIRSALGSLSLMSKDPLKRLESVQALFKTRSPERLPLLQKALERETESDIREQLQVTISAVQLFSLSETEPRLAAIEILAEQSNPEIKNLLLSLTSLDAEGQPKETDAKVLAAAKEAIRSIELSLTFWNGIGHLFRGLSLGSVLLLAAIGLAITFGVMGVINMAHGEMVMIGAYTTWLVQGLFHTYLPNAIDWALLLAVPAAFVVSGLVGIVIERGVIRFLYGRSLETLLATWGVSLILQQLIRSLFGPTNQEVSNPSWMSGAIEMGHGLVLTYNRIWIICFSLLVLAAIGLLLRRSYFGLQMRAVTQNRRMAQSMGTRTGRVDALTFGLGSGIAGMAGVALSQIDNVSPNLGQSYIIDSFMVVVFGGVGNLWGTLIGAFSLGIGNKFLEPFAGAVLGKILILVLIILFIQKRPRGMFALKGRAAEN
jgi:urea transport system permease protein